MSKYTPQSGIYIILNSKNGKVYIGQSQDLRGRWTSHKSDLKNNHHNNRYLQFAWNKYGEKVFKFKILEYCPIEKLDEREQHYLDIYIPKGICYNLAKDATAPMRGLKHTDDAKRKVSEFQKGKKRKPLSIELRQKLSEAHKGKSPSLETRQLQSRLTKGRPLSEEHKHKISIASKHRKPHNVTEETRRKMSEAHKGHLTSEETKLKISVSNTGKKRSDESKHRMSEAAKHRRKREKDNEPS